MSDVRLGFVKGVEDEMHPSRTSPFVLIKYFLHLVCRSGPKLLVKHESGLFVNPHPATYADLFCISFRIYKALEFFNKYISINLYKIDMKSILNGKP